MEEAEQRQRRMVRREGLGAERRQTPTLCALSDLVLSLRVCEQQHNVLQNVWHDVGAAELLGALHIHH